MQVQRYVPIQYSALLKFMQLLGFCEIKKIVDFKWHRNIEYRREFQLMITRAAFALVREIHCFLGSQPNFQ